MNNGYSGLPPKALAVILGLCAAVLLPAQESGDPAIAEKYLLWAEDAIAGGQWARAQAALERAADFADVMSDISYLLALARSEGNESRRSVLQALDLAIGTGRWNRYTEAQARLLEADQLIALRHYTAALDSLAVYRAAAGDDADSALLRLAALKGMLHGEAGTGNAAVEFRRRMLETLDRYPRDPRPLRVLFHYANSLQSAGRGPAAADLALMETALKRLPSLLAADPELAWMAAPFIGDTGEARRLVESYRAGGLAVSVPSFKPHPASLISALNLGLIDDRRAADELFAESVLAKDHITAIADLLRDGEGREYFVRKLHQFTGAITENEDHDDYPESRAEYRQGSLREYYGDTDQDGVTDEYIAFIDGVPQQAEYQRVQAEIHWEQYPFARTASLGNETYHFAPDTFPFAPVRLTELGAADNAAGLLFPERNPHSAGLNRRLLASRAASVQYPSAGFEGGLEKVLFDRGIPVRSEVTLNAMLVSTTEYLNGSPSLQRLDLDLDGRMETVRRFRQVPPENVPLEQTPLEQAPLAQSSESDWSGTGAFSTAELYQKDGSVVYMWDLDGRGMYRYSETRE